MKYLKQTLATYVYNHYNICNNPIYFWNIHTKHLQYTYETSETLEIYASNMQSIPLMFGRMEARRHVEFTGIELDDGVDLGALVKKAAAGLVEHELCAG